MSDESAGKGGGSREAAENRGGREAELEMRLAETERLLSREKEKIMLAERRFRREAETSARMEAMLDDMRDKFLRENRGGESDEDMSEMRQRVKNLEKKLSRERETWLYMMRRHILPGVRDESEILKAGDVFGRRESSLPEALKDAGATEDLTDKIAELHGQIEEYKGEKNGLQKELSGLKSAWSSLESQSVKLEKMAVAILSIRDAIAAETATGGKNGTSAGKKADAETALKESCGIKDDILKLKGLNAALAKECARLRQENAALAQNGREQGAQAEALRRERDEASARLGDLDKVRKLHTGLMDARMGALEKKYQEKIRRLESGAQGSLGSLGEEIQNLKFEKAEMKLKLESALAAADLAQKELSDVRRAAEQSRSEGNAELEAKYRQAVGEKEDALGAKAMEEQLENLKRQAEADRMALKQDLSGRDAEITELKEKVRQAAAEAEKLSARDAELQSAGEESVRARRQAESAAKELCAMAEKLRNCEAEIEKSRAGSAELEEKLRGEMNEWVKEASSAMEKVSLAENQAAKAAWELNEARENYRAEMEELKKDLEGKSERIAGMEEQSRAMIEGYEMQIAGLREECAALQAGLESSGGQNANADTAGEIAAAKAVFESKIAQVAGEKTRLEASIAELSGRVKTAEDKAGALQSRIKDLMERNFAQADDTHSLSKRHKEELIERERGADELKDRLSVLERKLAYYEGMADRFSGRLGWLFSGKKA